MNSRPISPVVQRISCLEVSSGRVFGSQKTEGQSMGDIFRMVEDLGQQIRSYVPQNLAAQTGGQSLTQQMTHSVEAYRSFVRGESHLQRQEFQEAAEEYQRATEMDPNFAMADYRLSIATSWLFDAKTSEQAINNALRLKDIFEIQDEIACSIAQALRITLTPEEENAIAVKPTENTKAYDYYLRGKGYMRRRTKSDLGFAVQMFEHAIHLDPKFALAFAGIGQVCGILYYWHGGEQGWIDTGLDACEKALGLVPDLPEALAARATIYYGISRYEDSMRDARRAIEQQPQCGAAFFVLGLCLLSTDRFQEAAALADQACRASGDEYTVYLPYYYSLDKCGDFEREDALRRLEIQALERQLEFVPEDVRARVLLAGHYVHFGKSKEGVEQLEKAILLQPDDRMVLYNAGCTYAVLGMKQKALKLLTDVIGKGFENLDWVARDPDLNSLHGEPEFEALVPNKKQPDP